MDDAFCLCQRSLHQHYLGPAQFNIPVVVFRGSGGLLPSQTGFEADRDEVILGYPSRCIRKGSEKLFFNSVVAKLIIHIVSGPLI
jgi:hypothetical protein